MFMVKIAVKILRWYQLSGRDLPWRNTKDPYKILVSEIMLQQTQVERVKIFYKNWLKEFPTWHILSQASNADVIHAWAGLGYNRRALVLRDIAKQVVEHGLPKNREEWMKLKGIGPYTSAAISCFALHQKVFPVDTNTRRVIARVFKRVHFPDLKQDKELESVGNRLLEGNKDFFHVPQAIFDLATDICKKEPDCKSCPIKTDCASAQDFLKGKVSIPKKMIKKAQEKIHRNKKYPDRIYRGRILALVRKSGLVSLKQLGTLIDDHFIPEYDQIWLEAMVVRLEKDRLILVKNKKVSLVN